MKTKHNDAGLIYMKELGFRPAKTIGGLFADIEKPLGKQYAEDFFAAVQARAEGNSNDDEIYHIIHRCFKTSMTITSAYSADYYRKVCNWLFDNKDCIKGRVLDVGCGNGILTCFIASRFPECRVVGVDCVEDAIKVAQQLAKKLQLTNVEFITADIREYEPEEIFDTIFSALTMTPFIMETFEEPAEYGYTRPLTTVIQEIQDAGNAYASILSNLAKDDACLLQVERGNEYSLLVVGWMCSMTHLGCYELTPVSSLSALESAMPAMFAAWILKKTNSPEKKSDEDLMDDWFKKMTDDANLASGLLMDNEAQAVLEYYPFEQEQGYIIRSATNPRNVSYLAYGWLTHNGTKHYVEYSGRDVMDDYGEPAFIRALLIDGCTQEDAEVNLKESLGSAKRNHCIIEPHYFGGMPEHCKDIMKSQHANQKPNE